MKKKNPQPFNLMKAVKKLFLSAFVVITFIGYALHKPQTGVNGSLGSAPVTGGATAQGNTMVPTTAPPANTPSAAPQLTFPTPTPGATALPPQNNPVQASGYRDGTYTGPEVDAIYGLVQVQAVVQNGRITNVQFLEYPNDRRTSVRINSIAVPDLQQEAIQAQNANVDLITGATLTSEAFQMSLQAALSKAKGSL
jgi:uncharacterized protein with FMN-binding domain